MKCELKKRLSMFVIATLVLFVLTPFVANAMVTAAAVVSVSVALSKAGLGIQWIINKYTEWGGIKNEATIVTAKMCTPPGAEGAVQKGRELPLWDLLELPTASTWKAFAAAQK